MEKLAIINSFRKT